MTVIDLQHWLNAHGQTLIADGVAGPKTRAAIVEAFTNRCAAAISDVEIETLAIRLGCSAKQIRAVAKVESGGAAFDDMGRPKILFERHLFHRLTNGRHSPSPFSQAKGGGYNESSWDKLCRAASVDPEAAFAAASWGKFQVLGTHWRALRYLNSLELAYSTVISEAAHYELLARYIEVNGLKWTLKALSPDPDDNRAFAKGYNGPAYERFSYHTKLAAAMA
jgi:hypothetical protein